MNISLEPLRTCEFSASLSESLPFIQYQVHIDDIESLDDIVALCISYLRDYVQTHIKSPKLLEEIDACDWHIHNITLEDIFLNPDQTIWICNNC